MNWVSVTSSQSGQYVACAGLTNAGIYISTNYGYGEWSLSSAPLSSWAEVVMSGQGMFIYGAVVNGSIYKNSAYGLGSWSNIYAPTQNWKSLAIDQTGTFIAAGVLNGGIYASSNGGQTFKATEATPNQWYSIALSAPAQVNFILLLIIVITLIITSMQYSI